MANIRLVAVVVTYNRLEKLKKALMSYDTQTQQFSYLVVVNNCSTDGTEDYLKEWEQIPAKYEKHVFKTESNIGGAGGFYTGMAYAMKLAPDWVWLADDDAYPENDSFEKFYGFIAVHKNIENVSAICASVIKPDGNIDIEHRGYISHGLYWRRRDSNANDYLVDYFKIDLLSYVGVAINVKALFKVGLTKKDFFIHFDDSEHSLRLRKVGDILCVPSIHVIHDAYNSTSSDKGRNYNWKTYYGIRNIIYSFLRHHIPTAIIWTVRIVLWQNFLFLTGRINKKSIKLMMTAVWDGWKGNLGIHDLYKPGFKI